MIVTPLLSVAIILRLTLATLLTQFNITLLRFQILDSFAPLI